MTNFQINSHWFRRMVHVSGACVLSYYLIPVNIPWVNNLKITVALAVFLLAASIEIIRLQGKLSKAFLFPFRKYETYRVGAHIWLGASAIFLLLFFPQQIAAPCILAVCFADPVIGELRKRNKVAGVMSGFIICLGIFALFDYSLYLALLLGGLAVAAESLRVKSIDDNLLMPLIPAIIILVGWGFNLISLPKPLLAPFGV